MHTGCVVKYWTTGADRAVVALIGSHKTRCRLNNIVEPRTVSVRTGLAERRNRGIHDRVVHRSDVVVTETVTSKRTGTIVLEKYVGTSSQLKNEVASFRLGNINRQAAFAGILGHEPSAHAGHDLLPGTPPRTDEIA